MKICPVLCQVFLNSSIFMYPVSTRNCANLSAAWCLKPWWNEKESWREVVSESKFPWNFFVMNWSDENKSCMTPWELTRSRYYHARSENSRQNLNQLNVDESAGELTRSRYYHARIAKTHVKIWISSMLTRVQENWRELMRVGCLTRVRVATVINSDERSKSKTL
jgi:hypothetical protein